MASVYINLLQHHVAHTTRLTSTIVQRQTEIVKMVRLNCIEENCSFKTQDLEFGHAEKLLHLHLDRRHPQNGPRPCPMDVDPDQEHKKEAEKPRVLNPKDTVLRISNVPRSVSEADIQTFLAKMECEPRSIHFDPEKNGAATEAYLNFSSSRHLLKALTCQNSFLHGHRINIDRV